MLAAKVASLVAGGNDRVVWLQFENAIEVKVWEGGSSESTDIERRIVRGSELITAASGWKAVAAAFSTPGEPEPRQPAFAIPDPTEPGPPSWRILPARSVRDDPAVAVHTAEWGFVHANVALPVAGESLPARAAVQLVALPDASGGWSIVSVHYAAL